MLRLTIFTALLLTSLPSFAQSSGPFAGLAGSWSGGGSVHLANGSNERVRCRANYSGAETALHMNLRCASDSHNFNLTSNIQASGNTISGSWTEANGGASGSISGTANGGQIQAQIRNNSVAANVSVSTRGTKQSINIKSSSGEITGASVSLVKK